MNEFQKMAVLALLNAAMSLVLDAAKILGADNTEGVRGAKSALSVAIVDIRVLP